MKILFITPCYIPANGFGGTVSAISQLCEALAAQGDEVTVFTTNSNGALGKLDVDLNKNHKIKGVLVKYFECNVLNSKAYYSKTFIQYLKTHTTEFDAAYISAIWQMLGPASAKVFRKNKIPYIVGTHGSFSKILRKKKIWIKNMYYQFFLKSMVKGAEGIHITCNKEKEDADHWLTHEQYFVVPNVLNPNSFSPQKITGSKAKYNIPTDAKVIVTAARPDWMKRIDLLIECIAERENYYLIYAGEDNAPIVEEWKAKARQLGAANRFIATGLLNYDDLTTLYNASDVFCLISENENFGMVVAEAMLCNKPVVLSKMAGISEYLKNKTDVQLVDNNVKDILLALDKTLARKDSIEARATAIDLFSPERVGASLTEMFEKTIA